MAELSDNRRSRLSLCARAFQLVRSTDLLVGVAVRGCDGERAHGLHGLGQLQETERALSASYVESGRTGRTFSHSGVSCLQCPHHLLRQSERQLLRRKEKKKVPSPSHSEDPLAPGTYGA